MKFYTWQLKWENNEGTDPSNTVNNDKVHASGQFVIDNTFYAIATKGQLDVSALSAWSVKEITEEEFLTAARTISPNADIPDNIFTMSAELLC